MQEAWASKYPQRLSFGNFRVKLFLLCLFLGKKKFIVLKHHGYPTPNAYKTTSQFAKLRC